MKNFQTIVLGIFILFIIIGVFAFASYGSRKKGTSEQQGATATVWGTVDAAIFNYVVGSLNEDFEANLTTQYTYIRPEDFDTALVEALASNEGPDVIFVPYERITRHQERLFTIPFESLPERLFRDTFIDEANLYVTPNGILGLPAFVDPIVMYWNRKLFNNAGVPTVPRYWDELVDLSKKLTITDSTRNILQSTISLGEVQNVHNAKEIIATLLFQSGNPITTREEDRTIALLGERLGFSESPAVSALRFYTEFANPTKSVYSWNKALPDSQQMFLAGNLALYLGFGSELFNIQNKNPNLNFDVAPVPQVRDTLDKATFGRMYGFSVMNQSSNKADAIRAITLLSSPEASTLWSEITQLAPVRRDTLTTLPTDPYRSVFYQQALVTKGFIDPNVDETGRIFSRMVEDINSGRASSVVDAVDTAENELNHLLGNR